MCYLPSIVYACHGGRVNGVHEFGCQGEWERKTTLTARDSGQPAVPLPLIRYCQEGHQRKLEGRSPCKIRVESLDRREQVACPVRCPSCVKSFASRLEPDAFAIASRIKEHHGDNRSDEERRQRCQAIVEHIEQTIARPGREGVVACERNWDAAMRQALEDEQALKGPQPVDIARTWPWLIRRPYDFDWYEKRVKEAVQEMVRQPF